MNETSILADVRSACNLEKFDTSFDNQLIPLINTQLMMAHQFGVGPDWFQITGESETWHDWLGPFVNDLSSVKTWVGFNVLLMFDPPDNSTVLKSYRDQIDKIEYMLREKVEEKGYVKHYVKGKDDFYNEHYNYSSEKADDVDLSEDDD